MKRQSPVSPAFRKLRDAEQATREVVQDYEAVRRGKSADDPAVLAVLDRVKKVKDQETAASLAYQKSRIS